MKLMAARVPVSTQLLIDVLHLPSGTTISSASYDEYRDYVELVLVHHDLPESDVTCLPIALPQFRKQLEVVFEGWGIEETVEK